VGAKRVKGKEGRRGREWRGERGKCREEKEGIRKGLKGRFRG
jgi:hypothetical protein